jgi:integrase
MRGNVKHYCRTREGRPARRDDPKKDHADGCATQRRGGWWYAVRVPTTPTETCPTGIRLLKRTGFRTHADAAAELARVIALVTQLDREDPRRRKVGDAVFRASQLDERFAGEVRRRLGVQVDPATPTPTVGELLDEWLDAKRAKAETTRALHRSYVDCYYRPHLGEIPLDRLTAGDVSRMFAWVEERNEVIQKAKDAGVPTPPDPLDVRRSPRVINVAAQQQVLKTLRAALNWAVKKRRLIPFNPCDGVELPGARRRPRHVWNPRQVGAFLQATEGDRLHAAFRLVLLRGLRRGEVIACRWDNLDLDAGRLHVRRQHMKLRGRTVEKDLKTEGSDRLVSLDAGTVAALRRWQETQELERGYVGEEAYGAAGYVFTREDGSTWRPDDITWRFKVLGKELGLPTITLHDGRHTAATLGLLAGLDVKIVSDQLGHASTRTTQDTYQFVLMEAHDAAAERVVDLLPGADS